ncbi:MAG: hypothetical protein VX293_03505 [Candidatus Latescibacterota bacterium]|nr:hypothetical protein [Candidatus Latescibacterota bacterium]
MTANTSQAINNGNNSAAASATETINANSGMAKIPTPPPKPALATPINSTAPTAQTQKAAGYSGSTTRL